MRVTPPFYPNSGDGVRCLPACLRMALHALLGRDPGASKSEQIAGFKPKKLTWNFRAYRECALLGLEVLVIDAVDLKAFATEPLDSLKSVFGEEDATKIASNSDIWTAACDAAALLRPIPHLQIEHRIPAFEDLQKAISSEALVLCGVDAKILSGLPPGSDHAVLCYGIENQDLWLHDPGLPPRPARKIPIDRFMQAWSWPCDLARWMLCLRAGF